MSKTKQRHKKNSYVESRQLAPVQDSVREYRVIEDGAYAYHLQNEEIENHYSQNVNMRRTVMDDIRKAKDLQDEEDRKARIMTIDEEIEAKQMDEELAEFIQEEIYKKNIIEEQSRKDREGRDQELALLMDEKDRRKVERAKLHEDHDRKLASRMQNMKVTPSPPDSRDEQRMKIMSDEELAKRLQEEEESKVERTMKKRDNLKSVVEMQDEELAKYIHGREVEAAEMKFKNERSKRRSKKKGKWDEEPLYYDDNVNPPVYQELHPKDHHGDHRRSPPKNQLGLSDHARSASERQRPTHEHQSDRKPERPPPPKFSESHNTEIKVPLDDSQRRNRERSQKESSRNHPDHRYNGHNSPHDPRKIQSERIVSRGSSDSLDSGEHHRSYSDKPRHRGERGMHNSHSQSYHGERERHHHNPQYDKERRNQPSHDRSSIPNRSSDQNQENGRNDIGAPVPKPRSQNHPHSSPNEQGMKKRHK